MAAVIRATRVTLAAGAAAANLNTIIGGAALSATLSHEIKIACRSGSNPGIQIGPTGLNVSSAPGYKIDQNPQTFTFLANDDPGTTVFLQNESSKDAATVDIYVRTGTT